MKLNIEIDTGSAAFSDTFGFCGTELSRILADLAGSLNAKTAGEVIEHTTNVLRDSNGNRCGRVWAVGDPGCAEN